MKETRPKELEPKELKPKAKQKEAGAKDKLRPKSRQNKPGKKDTQLLIRINSKERDEFVALCEELDTSAAREIRRFIRGFLKEHN